MPLMENHREIIVMMMQAYRGKTLLLAHEKQRLLAKAKLIKPSVISVDAISIYFTHHIDYFSHVQQQKLLKLLELPANAKNIPWDPKHSILIMPRKGVLTTWSQQFQQVCYESEIPEVMRVECAVLYQFKQHHFEATLSRSIKQSLAYLLCDPLLHQAIFDFDDWKHYFQIDEPKSFQFVNIIGQGINAIEHVNNTYQLKLTQTELEKIYKFYLAKKRNPTELELMTHALVNTEHKQRSLGGIDWVDDDKKSLTHTLEKRLQTAISKNTKVFVQKKQQAAVIRGEKEDFFYADPYTGSYLYDNHSVHKVINSRSDNTSECPYFTGAVNIGAEVSAEVSFGRGAKPRMGAAGLFVSDLQLPNFQRTWEKSALTHAECPTALQVTLDVPVSAARFSNGYGRPTVVGVFRTYETKITQEKYWGYHQAIVFSAGMSRIREASMQALNITPGTRLAVIGSAAMPIGLHGMHLYENINLSSVTTQKYEHNLSTNILQISNPGYQRRCQNVINGCWQYGENNPIIAMQNIAEGGLGQAMMRLLKPAGIGAKIEIRKIHVIEKSMSLMALWANTVQERFLIAVKADKMGEFVQLVEREKCPIAIIGQVTADQSIEVYDEQYDTMPLAMRNSTINHEFIENKQAALVKQNQQNFKDPVIKDISEAIQRVLTLPSVGDKSHLIHILDRQVGGLVSRDQLVGPWQVPVSDVGVIAKSFLHKKGDAMALGERTPIAIVNPIAAARMAVGEAITNIVAADVNNITDISLALNWTITEEKPEEASSYYQSIAHLIDKLCPELGVVIADNEQNSQTQANCKPNKTTVQIHAPTAPIVTAYADVENISKTLTPMLQVNTETSLLLIDLSEKPHGLAGSALAQVYQTQGKIPPEFKSKTLVAFVKAMQQLRNNNLILAYHDRSDGGLFITLCEMAFATRCGLDIDLTETAADKISALFHEGLGAVIQVPSALLGKVRAVMITCELINRLIYLGKPTTNNQIIMHYKKETIVNHTRPELRRLWSFTSYRLQAIRDNPKCAKQAYESLLNQDNTGLNAVSLTYNPEKKLSPKIIMSTECPKVAVLRAEGTTGHHEIAAALQMVGFAAFDIHINDIKDYHSSLTEFVGLIMPGGHTRGDVLGAGKALACEILHNSILKQQFKKFFELEYSFTLGVGNGCQTLSYLQEIIPGTAHWPELTTNESGQYECRWTLVKILESPSIVLRGMEGSVVPVAIAHSQGQAKYNTAQYLEQQRDVNTICMKYVDYTHADAEHYPENPDGSYKSICGMTTTDGRVTLMMPRPERGFRAVQYPWHPADWGENGAWLRIFQNARLWAEMRKPSPIRM